MEWLVFLQRFLARPATVGSLAPSSRFLVDRMLTPITWDRCRAVAELGAGTGTITHWIRQRLSPGAQFLVFERDPVFRSRLAERWRDLPLYGDAFNLRRVMAERGLQHLDAIVSSLPFSLIPAAARITLLDEIRAAIAPGGVFVAFQYSPHLFLDLQRRFRTVALSLTLCNLPPAFVYVCKHGRDSDLPVVQSAGAPTAAGRSARL